MLLQIGTPATLLPAASPPEVPKSNFAFEPKKSFIINKSQRNRTQPNPTNPSNPIARARRAPALIGRPAYRSSGPEFP